MGNPLTINGAIQSVAGGDPIRADIFREMESREDWILDRPKSALDEVLSAIGEQIESNSFDVGDDVDPEDMIDVFAMIRSGRFYRLFQSVGAADSSIVDYVIGRIDQVETSGEEISPELNVIRSRLLVAKQIGYLHELFSADRVRHMKLAVEDSYEEDY